MNHGYERRNGHSLVERRRFSIVFPPPTQGDRISPYYRFHCQRCFVYPSRRSTSSILPNMSTRTALHLPIFRRRPGGLGRWGSDSSATGRVSASCMGCPPDARQWRRHSRREEIDSIKQFDPRNKRGYVLYAFTARNRHHRVRVARAQQPAGRGLVDRADVGVVPLRCERIADAGSSRRVAPWHLAWCLSSHISP